MSAGPALKPMPTHRPGDAYEKDNERRHRARVSEELGQKHDKRSDLRVGQGYNLILTSPGFIDYAIGFDDDGLLTVTNYETGAAGTFVVNWEDVEGLSQQLINLQTGYETADSAQQALITSNATLSANNAGAIATLQTQVSALSAGGDVDLITNPDFEIGIGGWTNGIAARGDISGSAGRLVVTNDHSNGSTSGFARAVTPVTTEIGSDYTIYAEDLQGTSAILASDNSDGTSPIGTTVGTGNQTLTFTATATTTYIGLYVNTATDAATASAEAIYAYVAGSSQSIMSARIFESLEAIADNEGAIATNTTAISANATSISTNTGNITQNAADIVTEQTARASGDSAAATDRALIRTEFASADSTLQANIDSEATARASGDAAIASDVTTLTASIRGGPNLIPYARFDDVDAAGSSSVDPKGWDGRANIGGMSGASVGVTGSGVGASNQPPGLRCLRFFQPASQTTGYSDAIYNGADDDYTDIPCIPGQRYCASVFANAQNGTTIDVRLNFRDSSGSFISDGDNDDVTNGTASTNLGVGANLSDFERIWVFADAPSNATFVSIQVFKYPDSGGGQSFGFVTLPMIEEANANQENPSPWTDAPRNAEVSINATAIADIEGNLTARFAIAVDGGGNGSFISLEDGTTEASTITLSADEITLDGDVIVTGSITTDRLQANAVTNTEVDQTSAATSPANLTWTTVASFSFTSVGIGVQLRGSCDVNIFTDGSTPTAQFRLRRDTTVLKTSQVFSFVDAGSGFQKVEQSVVLDYNDLPSSGTYTYELQARLNEGTGAVVVSTFDVSNRFLSAVEFKR